MMKFPSIRDVARELSDINANVESDDDIWSNCGCDVRLQVYPDGQWCVRVGLADYDQDHRGYWGADRVPGVFQGKVQRFNSTEVARDLIAQCREMEAEAA